MESEYSDSPIIVESGDAKSDLKVSMEDDGEDKNENSRSHEIGERLESVLEYTNRIKAFLGLEDEEPYVNAPHDSTREVEISTTEPIDEENSQPQFEISATLHNESTLHPLPDIVGVRPGCLEESEQFPDILERGKNFKVETPEGIFENASDITGEEMNDLSIRSDNNQDIDESNIVSTCAHPPNESVDDEKPLTKTECKSDVTEADSVQKAIHGQSSSEKEGDITQSQNNDLTPTLLGAASEKERDVTALERNTVQLSDKSEETQNKEDSDSENPYQITHIEEGLRQTEKSSKSTFSPEPDEQQTKINDGVQQDNSSHTNPSACLKRRSKLSLEDIRRLSTEVVNTVLQTAGDEVKMILQNYDSTTEENSTNDVESPEIISPVQDTQVEYHTLEEVCLADVPQNSTNGVETPGIISPVQDTEVECHTLEEVCLAEESQLAFSDKTDINSSENVTITSIAMMPVGSKHSIDRIEVMDEIDFDTQCGFGPFKPQCIQAYATANVYVILYSIIGILHGSYYTYLVGVLTTLEKRFEFKSKTSGFIMMLDELTPLFLGVLVGHFGGRAHRPRLLSFGMFLSAFCCFASALPYFLYGTATHLSSIGSVSNKTSIEMCNGDVRMEHCDEDDRPPTLTAILLLMLGSFLKGFGNLAYYAIGLAYLDDNAKKRNTPLYFAVAFALRLLGPMVGFLMSSAFLKCYENPFETPDFGPDDPRWIGGWWMGFVLQGVLLLIFAGPMALFPRRLPDHRPLLHEIEHNTNSMFDGLGDSLKRLARNPLYMLIGLNAIFTVYGNFGYYIMLPKYMENQFRLSASSASLFAGPPGIAALMCSCIIGGYLIWKFNPTVKFLAGGLVTLELISTVGYLILMIPQCEKIEMTHFGFGDEGLILDDVCNLNCSCSTVSFTPVCGPDGKSYFSPCYAGCSSHLDQSFYNCSCLLRDFSENAVVTKGMCSSENCWSQALAYIVTLPVLQFIVNILRVAYTMIMLRSIKPEDKNIALGVFETVLSTVAFIPFPVLYGGLVDSACLVWEKSCGETGNCWFYDIQKFNYLMHGGSAFFCALSTLNLVAIFFLVNRIKDLYKDEEEET